MWAPGGGGEVVLDREFETLTLFRTKKIPKIHTLCRKVVVFLGEDILNICTKTKSIVHETYT